MNLDSYYLTSDYPIDKVIYRISGSSSVGAYDYRDTYLNHGLSFTPLLEWRCSFNSGFSTAYNTTIFFDGGGRYNFAVTSTSSQTIVRITNGSGNARTFFWQIWGFLPPNVSPEVAETVPQNDSFMLNTDYNYLKLVSTGTISVPRGNMRGVGHGLGKVPFVKAWLMSGETGLVSSSMLGGGSLGAGVRIQADSSNVFFAADTFSDSTYAYRIYSL